MKQLENLCLIDDDEVFRYLTSKIILETNLVSNVSQFENGLEAIDYLGECAGKPEALPDVIFLDLSMPVLDGWGFLDEYIRLKPELKREIQVYIVSSSIAPSDYQRAKQISEVKDLVIKPITRDGFREIISGLTIN